MDYIYDDNGNVSVINDYSQKHTNPEKYEYDKFGNVIKYESYAGESNPYTSKDYYLNITYNYDKNNNVISKSYKRRNTTDLAHDYQYEYTEDYEPKLKKTILPNQWTQTVLYDNLDRTKELSLNDNKVIYNYLKNIEVRENGELFTRYKYDSMNRLIREDNKHFYKTCTWTYDAGGNIQYRYEYEYTLNDTLDEDMAFCDILKIKSKFIHKTNF